MDGFNKFLLLIILLLPGQLAVAEEASGPGTVAVIGTGDMGDSLGSRRPHNNFQGSGPGCRYRCAVYQLAGHENGGTKSWLAGWKDCD